jgi:dipeptidyl aminopeptidase/acylaminoacyl peptidase
MFRSSGRPIAAVAVFAALLHSALATSIAAQSAPAAPASPTLESILSAPFPSEMLAAPTGGALAWIHTTRGVRNIWMASPPDYRGRQLTGYGEDDGQDLGGLEWAPDAKSLVFVRGGSANAKGEQPNPTSDPAGVEQAVWRVALDGGAPKKLGKGSGAVFSPRGDGVAFRGGGKIWWAALAPDGSAAEPKVLAEVRRGAAALRFSPDGTRLAFVSDRGDHAFVGVYEVAAKSVRWLAPSVDRDSGPAWSRDGRKLAFLREPADLDSVYFHSRRTAQPWSILVADLSAAAEGADSELPVRTVFTSHVGRGSAFHPMLAANQLLWGAGDRLVFPWERDGWLHLYSVPAAGGEAKQLTSGTFEIENVVVTPDGRDVVFNSNQGDPERRHLWRVPVAGGMPAQLTRGEEIAWMPAVIPGAPQTLAFFRAGPRRPAEAVIRLDGAAERPLAPETMPADYPADQLVEPQPVAFEAQDGVSVRGQLFLPHRAKARERHPAVIFLHGGPPRQMLLGWHYMAYYNYAYGMNQYLASRGFVVLALNFRTGIGYGLEFREALDQGAEGASEFQDLLAAAGYLRARPEVDAERIGLWGGSYGGYLTAHGLARASHLFEAGVDIHGVHDWNEGIRLFFPTYDPLARPAEARAAFESSPLHFVDGWRSPVLVIHGDDDRNVDFEQTVRLVQELRERRVEVEQLVLPDEVHDFLTWKSWLAVYRATAEFLERRLARAN